MNDDTPQIYAACGRGTRSTFRILKHGLEVSEMAVSELPGSPNAVWTVKKTSEDDYDAYIIVSFVNATLVLSIGETVEEVTDSGFLGTTPTLSCSLIGKNIDLINLGLFYFCREQSVQQSITRLPVFMFSCSRTKFEVIINSRRQPLKRLLFRRSPFLQFKEFELY